MGLLFWPFKIVWAFIGFLFGLMGRMISAIVGILLLAAGIILTVTFVGAFVGIPLIITGFLLIIRSIF